MELAESQGALHPAFRANEKRSFDWLCLNSVAAHPLMTYSS
uniref:Uncharacterized protein n=1 Tax=Anguilla anguilla TaxID=7936 RepID=A0A0E9PFF6_ANGAN